MDARGSAPNTEDTHATDDSPTSNGQAGHPTSSRGWSSSSSSSRRRGGRRQEEGSEMTRVDVVSSSPGEEDAGKPDAKTPVTALKPSKKSNVVEVQPAGKSDRTEMECDEADPEQSPTMKNYCCRSCTPMHNHKCKVSYFLVIFLLDVADLVSDWLFFADVYLAEEGLVYGPPGDDPTYALLFFSIIGSLTFFFESVNLWYEVFHRNPWLDSDLVSALVIWFEDLPQIAINVSIAICREDPISVFQLTKASVVIIGLLLRIIISLVKYCNKAALKEANQRTAESRRHVAYRVFIMLGLIINSACASAVFVFTQTQNDPQGGIMFQVPKTIFEDKYNDERYFQNVSVFVHHPDFDQNSPNATTKFQANWVRFMSINDIRDQDDLDISYNYVYEKTGTHLLMALYDKEDLKGKSKQGKWGLSECYQMEWQTRLITVVSEATCQSTTFFSRQAISVFITFSFTPPDKFFRRLVFGDIRFNIKVSQNGSCTEFDDFTDSVGNNVLLPAIHYYRLNASLTADQSHHLLMEPDGSGGQRPRFYRSDNVDMEDITTVWKTGWNRCESSGSKAPHLDTSIPTDCSNIASAVTG